MSKIPGTGMTRLNSMLEKGAYKDSLGTAKSDLHEKSVRGLCAQWYMMQKPL